MDLRDGKIKIHVDKNSNFFCLEAEKIYNCLYNTMIQQK